MIKTFIKWGSSLAAVAAIALSLAFTGNAGAATSTVLCADLPAAIAAASAGDTLNVAGNCTLTTTTVVDKQLTIIGDGAATISTNGTAQILTLTADGTTIQNLNFVKTDKTGVQNIIGIQGDNVSILNNNFYGQYVLGDPEVSRALEVSTVTNLTVNDNTFNHLRQPAYINDFATGTINNNYVNETRGFVLVANTDFTFSSNTWGTNALDIVFIPGTPNNYSCEAVRQIVRDNNNAVVQNQAQVTPCPTYPSTKDSCKNNGYKTFTGVTFKNQGDCVSYVASGGKSGGNQ
jgi:nitrous oxidase accessory protein NosD